MAALAMPMRTRAGNHLAGPRQHLTRLGLAGARGWNRRSRRLLETTNTELNAIAAAAISGLRNPSAASEIAAAL